MLALIGGILAFFALLGLALFIISLLAGGKHWRVIFFGVIAAWLILPTIILQVEWGYHVESGSHVAEAFWGRSWNNRGYSAEDGARAARQTAKLCGEGEVLDTSPRTSYVALMAESGELKRFFYHSKYGTVAWLGVGSQDRYCLARYYLAKRDGGKPSWYPITILPFPLFPWDGRSRLVEERLIERIPTPPDRYDGVRRLLPGQCVAGEIHDGETLRFEVRMPYFGEEVRLEGDLECEDATEKPDAIEWRRDGRPVPGSPYRGDWLREVDGGGLFEATVRAPGGGMRRYTLAAYWDFADPCHDRSKWRGGCACPNAHCRSADQPPTEK